MQMAPPSLAPTTSSLISTVHPDIIESEILTRLDASALASASCVSSQLYSLVASNGTLWTNICNSTWPSTNTPRMRHVISSFPNGSRSFFSESFTNPDTVISSSLINLGCPSELISAVDIHYQNKHIFGKVVETDTFNNSSLFRVDLLDPKDSVPTGITHPVNEEMSRELGESFTLSWILVDPIGRRAMNLSSHKPVTVERRSLSTAELHLRYSWVFNAGVEGSTLEHVKCGISVTCEGSESGEMCVRKVSLDLEDAYGKKMSGKDSLIILQKGMAGKRGSAIKEREEEGKKRYEEYMKTKRERIVSEVTKFTKLQAKLDTLYAAFGVLIIASLGFFVFRRFIFLFF